MWISDLKRGMLRNVYPLFMRFTKALGANAAVLQNTSNLQPYKSLFDLQVCLINGQQVPLSNFKGKKILLVNTASNCGYTHQYAALQTLADNYTGSLEVIAFPANDFKEQEKSSDADIALFCQKNYGIRFLLASKSSVVKGKEQNPVFAWLTNAALNGWNDQAPQWNFSKYLVDEAGVLTHYFGPSISPDATELINAVQSKK